MDNILKLQQSLDQKSTEIAFIKSKETQDLKVLI